MHHAKLSPLAAPVDEGQPTPLDRLRVACLRREGVAWMQAPKQDKWRKNAEINPANFLPHEDYLSGEFPLEQKRYGTLDVACAYSAVLSVDIVSLNDKTLGDMKLPLFSAGKQCSAPADEIYNRIQDPTGVPLLVVAHNGHNDISGHFASYCTDGKELIAAPSEPRWKPPPWLAHPMVVDSFEGIVATLKHYKCETGSFTVGSVLHYLFKCGAHEVSGRVVKTLLDQDQTVPLCDHEDDFEDRLDLKPLMQYFTLPGVELCVPSDTAIAESERVTID